MRSAVFIFAVCQRSLPSLGGSNERAFNLFDQVAEKFHHWFSLQCVKFEWFFGWNFNLCNAEFHAVSLVRRCGWVVSMS